MSMKGTIYSNKLYVNLTETEKIDLIQQRLVKYTPGFVVKSNVIFLNLMRIIAKTFFRACEVLYNMRNEDYSGKGLRLSLDNNDQFYKTELSDEELQDVLTRRFENARERGTKNGIRNSIEGLNSVLEADVEFIEENVGWQLGVTYPNDELCFLGMKKVVKCNYANWFSYGYARYGEIRYGDSYLNYDKELREIILDKIVPVELPVIFD